VRAVRFARPESADVFALLSGWACEFWFVGRGLRCAWKGMQACPLWRDDAERHRLSSSPVFRSAARHAAFPISAREKKKERSQRSTDAGLPFACTPCRHISGPSTLQAAVQAKAEPTASARRAQRQRQQKTVRHQHQASASQAHNVFFFFFFSQSRPSSFWASHAAQVGIASRPARALASRPLIRPLCDRKTSACRGRRANLRCP